MSTENTLEGLIDLTLYGPTRDKLSLLRDTTARAIVLQVEQAALGHDWVVTSQVLTAEQVLAICAYVSYLEMRLRTASNI